MKVIEEKMAKNGEESGTKTEKLLWRQSNRARGNKEGSCEERFRTRGNGLTQDQGVCPDTLQKPRAPEVLPVCQPEVLNQRLPLAILAPW